MEQRMNEKKKQNKTKPKHLFSRDMIIEPHQQLNNCNTFIIMFNGEYVR